MRFPHWKDLHTNLFYFQNAVKKLGRLDVLVLNHITLLDLGYWDGSRHNLSLIDRVLKVNFESYVYLASHSLPHLEASNGSIVVVSSLAGELNLFYWILSLWMLGNFLKIDFKCRLLLKTLIFFLCFFYEEWLTEWKKGLISGQPLNCPVEGRMGDWGKGKQNSIRLDLTWIDPDFIFHLLRVSQ